MNLRNYIAANVQPPLLMKGLATKGNKQSTQTDFATQLVLDEDNLDAELFKAFKE